MERKEVTHRIEKKDEKSYFFLPFEVPEGVETLEIKHSYDGDGANARITGNEKNVIDFGLTDEKGDDVGTRGSEVKFVYVSPSGSTSGYKKMPVRAGVWHIALGAYQIRAAGVEVKFEITFRFRRFRWLKGDTHIHTDNSDGKYTAAEIAAKAKRRGLDFIFITDHNNNLEGMPMPQVRGLSVIKGVELTNYKGHMNLIGVDKPYDGSYAISTFEEFQKRNEQARLRGALISINHFTCSLCPWLFGYEGFHYDAVEVWNGPMRKDNLKAVDWWDEQLREGRKLTAVGGSDYHRDFVVTDLFASPTLYVYADCNCQDAILDAIRKGRCVITYRPSGTMINMRCGDAGVGDEVPFGEALTADIQITAMKKNHILKVIDSDGVCFEFTAKKGGDYNFSLPVRKKGYIRCQIDFKKNAFQRILHRTAMYFMLRKEAYGEIPPFIHAMTNPIYFR